MVADVAIVGAGPAGAALAMELGARGARVVVYEKSARPRLKACGEGILPHGVRALAAIAGGLPAGVPVRGLRFAAGETVVDADFPEGSGLVVRRDRLHAWLIERAAATPNVDLRLGCRYTPDGARVVVGADGARSMFHKRLAARRPRLRRVGLSTHVAGLDGLGDRVEVFFHQLGELYLARTGPGEALVSALLYQSTFRRDGLTALIEAIPSLRERTARMEPITPLLASAPLGLDVPRVVDANLLLIGDAAGAPDPITGDGMALAFCSVVDAAEAIVSGDLESYQRTRVARGRSSARLGRLLMRMGRLLHHRSVRHVITRRPALIPTLVDVAVGRRPMTATTVLGAVV